MKEPEEYRKQILSKVLLQNIDLKELEKLIDNTISEAQIEAFEEGKKYQP